MIAFPKQAREINEEFEKFIRLQPCCYRGNFRSRCIIGDTIPHHIKTRGAGGGDSGNMIPVCAQHNDEAHRGLISKESQRKQARIYYDKYLNMKGELHERTK